MSMPYPQQPAGQPAVPAQPVQQAPQGVPQVGMPAQHAYQGGAPGYAPVPQGPVVRKVNWASIILGIVGWVLVGLTVLGGWPFVLSRPMLTRAVLTSSALYLSSACHSLAR